MSYSELRRRELQLQNSQLVISMCLFVQHIFSIKTSLYQNTHFCVLLIIHALRNIRDSVQTTFRTTSSETTGDTLSDAGHSLGSVRDPQALQALRRDVQQDRVLGRSPCRWRGLCRVEPWIFVKSSHFLKQLLARHVFGRSLSSALSLFNQVFASPFVRLICMNGFRQKAGKLTKT